MITVAPLYPLVTPNAWYVKSGQPILFTGEGFAPNEEVTISNTSTLLATVSTDANGTFANYSIPTDFGPDRTMTYTFRGEVTGAAASVTVIVAALQPSITPSTWYTARDMNLTFTGTEFGANEEITIQLNEEPVGSATADVNGSFVSGPILVPYATPSAHFTFIGSESEATATLDITLAPYFGQIIPSAWYAPVGSNMIFTGSGFAPGETVSMTFNDADLGMVTADTNGNVTTTPIHIPTDATYANFAFTGNASGSYNFIPIALGPLAPGLQLSRYYNVGGTPLSVIGMGFGTNETVAITFDGQPVGEAMSDNNGNFTYDMTVPYGLAGDKRIEASGQSSGAVSAVTFTQAPVYVDLQLGAYAGAPGASVNFIGNGYLPNEPITITTDRTGTTPVHNFNADGSGTFNNSGFTIPNDFIDPLTFTITGEYSLTSVNIVYYVTEGKGYYKFFQLHLALEFGSWMPNVFPSVSRKYPCQAMPGIANLGMATTRQRLKFCCGCVKIFYLDCTHKCIGALFWFGCWTWPLQETTVDPQLFTFL